LGSNKVTARVQLETWISTVSESLLAPMYDGLGGSGRVTRADKGSAYAIAPANALSVLPQLKPRLQLMV